MRGRCFFAKKPLKKMISIGVFGQRARSSAVRSLELSMFRIPLGYRPPDDPLLALLAKAPMDRLPARSARSPHPLGHRPYTLASVAVMRSLTACIRVGPGTVGYPPTLYPVQIFVSTIGRKPSELGHARLRWPKHRITRI
jgi:hypothetical protein